MSSGDEPCLECSLNTRLEWDLPDDRDVMFPGFFQNRLLAFWAEVATHLDKIVPVSLLPDDGLSGSSCDMRMI